MENREIKSMFRPIFHNGGLKLVSLLGAVVLWLAVLGSRSVEVSKDLPLEILLPEGLVNANEVPERATFRILGPKAFVRSVLERKDPPLQVHLEYAKSGLLTYRLYPEMLKLPLGVRVVSVHPNSVLLNLESVRTKSVPIRLELRGSVPEGYSLVRAQLSSPQIQIRGPKSRLSSISEVSTVPIDISELKESLRRETLLEPMVAGVTALGQMPFLELDIRPTSANFKLSTVPVEVQSFLKAVVHERAVTLFVRASAEALRDLKPNDVKVVVDMRGKSAGTHWMDVKVELPPTVAFVKALPERVRVDLLESD